VSALRYGVVLFDLDGTLTDSGPGITRSVRHALERLGRAVPDDARLAAFVGPPLLESFQRLAGLDEATARQAVDAYRERYAERGLFESQVYPGIEALLASLADKPCDLGLATSKPTLYAERILEHFRLRRFFRHVAGIRFDDLGASKAAVVRAALDALPDSRERRAVLVGDREHDVYGAAANGIDSIGVGYGYGSRVELDAAKPTYRVESVSELGGLLDGLT
jgi:phosphoglycolate phosphatase